MQNANNFYTDSVGLLILIQIIIYTTVHSHPIGLQIPPSIIQLQNNQSVKAGQDVYLECGSLGYPKPEITWIFGQQNLTADHRHRISKSSGAMVILSVTSYDSGWYSCQSSNAAGIDYRSVYLAVPTTDGPQTFKTTPESASLESGSTFYIKCDVAFQEGRAQWVKNGLMLGYDRSIPLYPRYHIRGEEGKGEHWLEIENSIVSDSGYYECQISPSGASKGIRAGAFILIRPKPILHVSNSSDFKSTIETTTTTIAGTTATEVDPHWLTYVVLGTLYLVLGILIITVIKVIFSRES